jgi:hypothetical protein
MTLLVAVILPLNVMSVSSISLSLVALKPTPPTDSQLGIRIATITYIDTVGNESASATASLQEAQRGFIINGESANDYSGWSVSNAGDLNEHYNHLLTRH